MFSHHLDTRYFFKPSGTRQLSEDRDQKPQRDARLRVASEDFDAGSHIKDSRKDAPVPEVHLPAILKKTTRETLAS